MPGAGSNVDQNVPKFLSGTHLTIYNHKQGVLNEYWQHNVLRLTIRDLDILGLLGQLAMCIQEQGRQQEK